MATAQKTMIRMLREKFDLPAVSREEWDGSAEGIWIRGDICNAKTDWYPYADGTMDMDNVLNRFLSSKGWFAEPYDSETIMMYKV